jgi:hypothetical protein
MRRYYVGLAVHSKQSAFVIEDEGGKAIARGEVPTTPDGFSRLQATYHLSPGTQVALETGTVAFFVARQLSRVGLDPVVVDAHEVRLKAQHRQGRVNTSRGARRELILGDSPSGTRGVHDDRDAGETHRGADPVEVIGHEAVDSPAPKEREDDENAAVGGIDPAEVRRL